MRITTLALLGLGLSLAACRGGDDSGDDAPGNPDGGTDGDAPGGGTRIQDVQSDSMAVGTAVSLKGVIVTAIDSFGAKTGDLFIQDPAGGPFSGVKVYGAALDQVALLVAGDVINLTGAVKDEFALTSDTTGRKLTELKPASAGSLTITKTGERMVVEPAVVDALAIEMMATQAERDAEWEKWEGVLITVKKARQVSAVGPFGDGAPDQQKFKVTGGLVVESVLGEFGANAVAGTCYQSLTGMGDYFFDYLLLPRDEADLVVGGTDCAPQSVATVTSIQMGTTTGAVMLNNVIVTARDDIPNTKGLWVADALQGAPYNGVFVYTGNSLDPALVIGSTVNVLGSVKEFDPNGMGDTVTEIEQAVVTLVPGTPGTPIPATTTAEAAGDIVLGEPFEGVFVSVSTVKVTNPNLGNNKVELTDNAGKKIVVDDDLFATGTFPVQTMGACLNVVGVMHLQLTDNIRTLLPRTAADFTAGTGCN